MKYWRSSLDKMINKLLLVLYWSKPCNPLNSLTVDWIESASRNTSKHFSSHIYHQLKSNPRFQDHNFINQFDSKIQWLQGMKKVHFERANGQMSDLMYEVLQDNEIGLLDISCRNNNTRLCTNTASQFQGLSCS